MDSDHRKQDPSSTTWSKWLKTTNSTTYNNFLLGRFDEHHLLGSPSLGTCGVKCGRMLHQHLHQIGTGGVLWDDNGNILMGFSRSKPVVRTVLEAELTALRKGVSWAKRFGFSHCDVDTYSSLAIDLVNNISSSASEAGHLVEDTARKVSRESFEDLEATYF